MRVKLNRDALKLFIFAVVVLLLLNFHCWSPGIGGRRNLKTGVRPPGSEMELYYGYPACHLAELWRSENDGDVERLLRNAPFVRPLPQMHKVYKSFGWKPTLINLGFALSVLGLIVLASHVLDHDNYSGKSISALIVITLFAIALHQFGDRASVRL